MLTGTLSLVLPVASSVTKLVLDETVYEGIEKQLDLGQKTESVIKGGGEVGSCWDAAMRLTSTGANRPGARRGVARTPHVLEGKRSQLWRPRPRDEQRQEFLWVHERFAAEY